MMLNICLVPACFVEEPAEEEMAEETPKKKKKKKDKTEEKSEEEEVAVTEVEIHLNYLQTIHMIFPLFVSEQSLCSLLFSLQSTEKKKKKKKKIKGGEDE